ncbi:MAG: SDR family oxidoreductase [Planctomycetota bacterium]
MNTTHTPGRCLVIGAGGGIGRSLCARLAAGGWDLLLAGRTREPLLAVQSETGGTVIELDGTEADRTDAAFRDAGDLTAAVCLAGSILLKPAHSTTPADFDQTIGQNLLTAFNVVRAAGKSMRSSGGSVVLMSSCAASVGLANHEAISAAKSGIEGLVRSAAATYASNGIRFNAVAPGLVETPMAAKITASEPALKASLAMHPLGRIGQPEDIARAIEFVLSPDASWLTGQVIGVDGGLARVRPR